MEITFILNFEGTVAEYEELMYAIDNAQRADEDCDGGEEEDDGGVEESTPEEAEEAEEEEVNPLWDTVPPCGPSEKLEEQEEILNNTRS